MSQVQLEAFFLVQNAGTAFPSTLVSMLELSPPLPILPLLRVAGLSGLNTIIVVNRQGIRLTEIMQRSVKLAIHFNLHGMVLWYSDNFTFNRLRSPSYHYTIVY
jgi:hypothetical protein